MNQSRLMIVMGDFESTRNALHFACAHSRSSGAGLVLVKLTPVRHPGLLGDPAGNLDRIREHSLALADLAATAEDYGVPLDVCVCQYASYWSGVLDAAEQLAATAVVIPAAASRFPIWQRFHRRLLQRRLARRNKALLSPEELSPMMEPTANAGRLAGTSVIAVS